MRKYMKFLAVLALVLFTASNVFAATKATAGGMDKGINYFVGVADASSGDTQEVDSSGNAAVELKNNANVAAVDANGNVAAEIFNNTNQLGVDADGAATVKDYQQKVETKTADAHLINTSGHLYKIILTATGPGAVYANIHDGADTSSAGEVEIEVAAGGSTIMVDCGRLAMTSGIYLDVAGDSCIVSVIYDD